MSELTTTEPVADSIPPAAIALPAGWVLLPSIDLDASDWTEAYLDELDPRPDAQRRAHLRYGLISVIELAAALPSRDGNSFALVPDPLNGVVTALLTLQLRHSQGDVYEPYLARVQQPQTTDGNETLNRTVEEIVLVGGRAIVLHDFVVSTVTEAVPDPALERAIVSLFLPEHSAVLEVAMYAQDLAAFDDMAQYLVDIVSAFSLSGASS